MASSEYSNDRLPGALAHISEGHIAVLHLSAVVLQQIVEHGGGKHRCDSGQSGAATVPFRPSTPWQVSQRLRSKRAFPRTASALSGAAFKGFWTTAVTALAALPAGGGLDGLSAGCFAWLAVAGLVAGVTAPRPER